MISKDYVGFCILLSAAILDCHDPNSISKTCKLPFCVDDRFS